MRMITVDQVYDLVDSKLTGKPRLKLTVLPQNFPTGAVVESGQPV
jgi:hypothetical protein